MGIKLTPPQEKLPLKSLALSGLIQQILRSATWMEKVRYYVFQVIIFQIFLS